MRKKTSYNFGVFAETLAVLYLKVKFYKILEQRYKSKVGEVDIIARRGNSLVFIEVKARKSAKDIHEVLSAYQQERITRAASMFLAKNKKFGASNIRFDLILIAPQLLIKHIKNAW